MTNAKISKLLMVTISNVLDTNKTPWLTLNQEGNVVGVYTNRAMARDSKTGKVVKNSEVSVVVEEEVVCSTESRIRKSTIPNATTAARNLIARMYGKAKPKEIFEEAHKTGIAFMTIRTQYQHHRKNLGLVKSR